MNLFQSLSGMLEAEITSGDIGKTLCMAATEGIRLYHVETVGSLSARFTVSRKSQKQLEALCRKRGDRLTVLRRAGVFWQLRSLSGRPLLLAGLPVLLVFFLFLPTRILFVQIEGNERIPDMQILEAAQVCGLYPGASRAGLQNEVFKNRLLKKLPQLSWAGVNTRGCVAVLTVRERRSREVRGENPEVCGMVASRDGIVDSCSALRGTLLCRPGQAIRKGQLLISGYTDCSSKIRREPAAGEVFARTHHSLTVISPIKKQGFTEKTGTVRNFSLRIGKKRINFPWNSGIWDTSCDRMYEEYYITLPGGYVLPVALAVDVYTSRDMAASIGFSPELQCRMASFSEAYLRSHMIAGSVLHRRHSYAQEGELLTLQGQYLCREMVGRMRAEKIGESYGEKH